MLGIATRLSTLRALRNRLASSGDSELAALAQLIDDHSGWANYGALGPAWGDLCPIKVDTVVFGQPGASPYAQLWKRVFNIFSGDGTPANPGLKPVLDRIRDLLEKLDAVAAAEDLDALKDMADSVNVLNQVAVDLTTVITTIKGDNTISNLGIIPDIAKLIGTQNKPAIVRPRPDKKIGFPAKFWNLREFLSWRRTGRFAKHLWQAAQVHDRPELRAFALGWLSSWAVAAGGASAVASIVGAPYRNQWWRARFVANYVDLWSFGYVEAGPATKPYTPWPNLCSAALNRRIEVPGTAFDAGDVMTRLRTDQALGEALPSFFTEYFVGAYDTVYGDLGTNRPMLDTAILQDGYAMTWLVLWFQTSPQSLGCADVAPMPPASCGTPPAWTTPVSSGSGGSGSGGGVNTPPAPSIDPKTDTDKVDCAIAVAILGIASFFSGGLAAGAAAIGAAIFLGGSAGTIDWEKFRCDLGWYRIYLFNGLRALHDVLSLGGLVHPYKNELTADETAFQLLKDADPSIFRTGDNIVMSKPAVERYPTEPWNGKGLAWIDTPTNAIEAPPTRPALAAAYPSGFIDDPANPLGSASVFDPFPSPVATSSTAPFQPGFINAADAVIGWLRDGQPEIPDRNLDGDRGLGYRGWEFVDDLWTNPVKIHEET